MWFTNRFFPLMLSGHLFSVSPPFLHCYSGTVSHSTGNIHPPSSLSNLLSIYSRQNRAGGCLTSLFFWTATVGNCQLWQTPWREVLKKFCPDPELHAWLQQELQDAVPTLASHTAGAAGLSSAQQSSCPARCAAESRKATCKKTERIHSASCRRAPLVHFCSNLKLPDSFFFSGKGLHFCKRWLLYDLGLLSWGRDHAKHMAILWYFLLPTRCKEGLSISCCFINNRILCSDDME